MEERIRKWEIGMEKCKEGRNVGRNEGNKEVSKTKKECNKVERKDGRK